MARVRVTDENIAELAGEAARSGDHKTSKVCGRALAGSAAARREVSKIIHAARGLAHAMTKRALHKPKKKKAKAA